MILGIPGFLTGVLRTGGIGGGLGGGTSMIVFTLLYAALGAVWYLLLRRYIREGVRTPAGEDAAATGDGAAAPVLSFEY